jgi:hypothetical protein
MLTSSTLSFSNLNIQHQIPKIFRRLHFSELLSCLASRHWLIPLSPASNCLPSNILLPPSFVPRGTTLFLFASVSALARQSILFLISAQSKSAFPRSQGFKHINPYALLLSSASRPLTFRNEEGTCVHNLIEVFTEPYPHYSASFSVFLFLLSPVS